MSRSMFLQPKDFMSILREILVPNEIVDNVEEINLSRLFGSGKRTILLDVDNTLLTYEQRRLSLQKVYWMESVKSMGFQIFFVSNNIRYNRLRSISDSVGVPGIYFALKPFVFSTRNLLERHQILPEHCIMVGDQVLTDVVMGNWLRAYTILVDPLNKPKSFLKTLQREIELFLLKKLDVI